jgi:hypothetical protein
MSLGLGHPDEGQKFLGLIGERIQGQTQRRLSGRRFLKAKLSESTLSRWESRQVPV